MMQKFLSIILLSLTIIFPLSAQTFTFSDNTIIKFLPPNDACAILLDNDEFITSLSPFDLSARLKTDKDVSTEEYLHLISKSILNWSNSEIDSIMKKFISISEKLLAYKINFPDTIYLIKTTGEEEGGSPYTRNNAIVLPASLIEKDNSVMENLLLHKLFHIYSRFNSVEKEKLYSVIGFEKCNEIEYPQKLSKIKITNPDSPRNDHLIKILLNDDIIAALPVTFSRNQKYDPKYGKEILDYLDFQLMVLDKADDHYIPKLINGTPEFLSIEQMLDYYAIIGRNTYYIIHPEEILADNFTFMILETTDLPSPEIIDGMKKVFAK
jgi:hypothetical protein